MARGFIAGLLVGGVASFAGLGTISLLSPLPSGPDVASAPDPTPTPQSAHTSDRPTSGHDADVVDIAPTAPAAHPEGDNRSVLADGSTKPAARPDVDDAPTGPGDLSHPGTAPELAAIAQRLTVLNTPGGLVTPEGEVQPGSARPAPPNAPQVTDANSAFAESPSGEDAPQVTAATDAALNTENRPAVVAGAQADDRPNASTDAGNRPDPVQSAPQQPAVTEAANSGVEASPG